MDFIKTKNLIIASSETSLGKSNLEELTPSESIIISKSKSNEFGEEKGFEVKSNFFVITLVQKNNEVVGLIAIDKLMGDVVCFQAEKIILDDEAKYFAESINLKYSSDIEVEVIAEQEFEKLCKEFLSKFRIIPDLEKIKAVSEQLDQIEVKPLPSEKIKHLIDLVAEIVERNRIENFDEKSNVYSVIEQVELDRKILNLLKKFSV